MNDAAASQVAQVLLSVAVGAIFLFAYRKHRFAALALLWVAWLILPFVRRMFDLYFGFTEIDALSVLPFALTVVAGLIELRSIRFSSRAVLVLGTAAAAFLVGVPAALDQPTTLAFGLLTYGGVMLAAPIGYADVKRQPQLSFGTLGVALLAAVPIIAVYAIVQYYALSLLPWDVVWVQGVDLGSRFSPERGHLRAFATLNTPGPFAAVTAVVLIVVLALPRLRPYATLVAALAAIALTLTFVRTYWLAVTVAAVVFLIASRRWTETLSKLGLAALIAIVVVVGGWQHPTVQAIVTRAETVATVSDDPSAQARVDFAAEIVPTAFTAKGLIGNGLGQSGKAVSIGGGGDYLLSDHGYLSILYQSGLVGLALMVVALLSLLVLSARQSWRGVPHAALHLALLAMFLVAGFFTDIFYGVLGVMLWYTAGRILALEEQAQPIEIGSEVT